MSGIHVRVRAGGEHYALAVEDVTEVGELGDVTPLPGAGREVLGVRNLRGQVIPVLDLPSVLGLETSGERERIVVAERGDRRAGLAVEGVDGVEALPDASEDTDSPLLTGAVLVDGGLVGIISADAVLESVAAAEAP
jgi:chemotaxis signal transduction protein